MERRRDPQAMPTLGGQVLPVGGIAEKVLAAHRGGLRRVILPGPNRRQVDHDLDDGIRRAVGVDYVTRVDELLELAFAAHAGCRQRGGGHAESTSRTEPQTRVQTARLAGTAR